MDNTLDRGSQQVSCPECGEDVATLTHTKYQSRLSVRLIPFLFVSLLMIGFGIWTSPWGQDQLGNSYGYWETTESFIDSSVRYLDSSISFDELQLAGSGDSSSINRFALWIDELLEEEQSDDTLSRVWIGTCTTGGSRVTDQRYGLGGIWYWKISMASLDDVRDPDSFGQTPYRMMNPSMSWLPLSFTEINHDGAEHVRTTYDLIGFLTHISICLLIVYVLRRVGKRMKVSLGQESRSRAVLFLMLFVSTMVYCLFYPYQSNDKKIGPIHYALDHGFSIEELKATIQSPQQTSQLAASLVEGTTTTNLNPGISREDHVVSASVVRGYGSQTKNWLASLGRYFPLVKLTKRVYFRPESIAESDRIESPDHLRNNAILDFGGLYWWEFRIDGNDSTYWLSFSPGYLCFVGVCCYWIWTFAAWIPRLVAMRIQSRRVRNAQCAFCSYPLSEEGVLARNEHSNAQQSTT